MRVVPSCARARAADSTLAVHSRPHGEPRSLTAKASRSRPASTAVAQSCRWRIRRCTARYRLQSPAAPNQPQRTGGTVIGWSLSIHRNAPRLGPAHGDLYYPRKSVIEALFGNAASESATRSTVAATVGCKPTDPRPPQGISRLASAIFAVALQEVKMVGRIECLTFNTKKTASGENIQAKQKRSVRGKTQARYYICCTASPAERVRQSSLDTW